MMNAVALESRGGVSRAAQGQDCDRFLGYMPIVEDYDRCGHRAAPVAVISYPCETWCGSDSLFYVGSHGFEIVGAKGWQDTFEKGVEALPELERAERELREEFRTSGARRSGENVFSNAIHFRRAAPADALGAPSPVSKD